MEQANLDLIPSADGENDNK